MDVTRIISRLRSEREEIEQAILFLERFDRPVPGHQKQWQSVVEFRSVKKPEATNWFGDEAS